MNKPSVGISDDYAVLTAKNVRFYFGYECTVNDGDESEWCFEARLGDGNIIIPQSKLGTSDRADMAKNLLAGIGWVLAKYKLVEDV